MKSAEEIFNEHSWKDLGAISPSGRFCIPAMKEYAKQVAEETLKMAANGCVFIPSLNEYVNEKSCIEDTIIFLP